MKPFLMFFVLLLLTCGLLWLLAGCVSGTISYEDPKSGFKTSLNITPKPEK